MRDLRKWIIKEAGSIPVETINAIPSLRNRLRLIRSNLRTIPDKQSETVLPNSTPNVLKRLFTGNYSNSLTWKNRINNLFSGN